MHPLARQAARAFALPQQLIEIVADDLELLDWLSARVPTAPPGSSPARVIRVFSDGDAVVLMEDGRPKPFRGTRDAVAVRLLERLNELACFTSPALTVHSGLVADEDGRSIWIPAASGGGKSTLTAQLTMRGMRYGTDEVVIVDASGRLTGWPKWLCVKQGSHGVLRPLRPSAGDLVAGGRRWMVAPRAAGDVLDGRVAPFLIVLPTFDESIARTDIAQISKAEAVAAVAPQVFNLRAHGARGVDLLAEAVDTARSCVRVSYGDGWDAADALIAVLRSMEA